MPAIFEKIDKIKPAYDITYKVVLFVCKLLLIADILITSMAVAGRYISFIPDPAWSEEIVLTCMSYMAVLSAALAIRRGAHIRMTALDTHPGVHHDRRGLELRDRHRSQGFLREHAVAVQILDVFPGTAGRRCHARI